jgi:ABC-type branched-chain amino acid transport system, permease component
LLGARDPRRMITLGTPIERDVSTVFAIASAMAGAAGALLTQTTQFVSPATLSSSAQPTCW